MASVIIIEPAPGGLAVVEAARTRDRHVLLLASPKAGAQARRTAESHGAEIIDVDTNDVEAVLAAVRKLAAQYPVEAVVPGMDYYVHAAAACAEALGLPGLSPALARRLRNKYEVRRCVAEAGIATPGFALVGGSDGDVERAADITGFPAVLKPVDASGSLGVQRVDNLDELRQVVEACRAKELYDVGRRVGNAWMLESYLDGPEYSVEGLITDAGPHVLAVTKKALGPEPYFIEVGHIVGADLPAALREGLARYTERVIAAIELPLGVFHVEVRETAKGPMLIEVNVRLPGDRITRLVQLACGFSLPDAMLRSHVEGLVPVQDCRIEQKSPAGVRFVTRADVRQVPTDADLEALRAAPGTDEVVFTGIDQNPCCAAFRDRVGHVVCTAPTAELLESRLHHAEAVLRGMHAGTPAEDGAVPETEAACC